ncbi:hypothetical protein ACFW04_004175 [Cataglyphis niger]
MAVTAWNAWNVARHAAPAQSHGAIHRSFGPLSIRFWLVYLNPNVMKRVSACSSQRPGQDRTERKKEKSPVMISSRLNSTSGRESQGRIFDCSAYNGNKFFHMTCYDVFRSIAIK